MNKDKEIANIEAYLKEQIESYFPIKIKYFAVYDLVDNAYTGVFVSINKKPYDFVIEQSDGLPVLKPHLPIN